MRRLLAFLIALSALFAVQPCAAAPAKAAPHAMAMAMPTADVPAMPCHEDRGTDQALHACLGCAVQPDAALRLAPPRTIALVPPKALPAGPLPGRAIAFDPPPPRAAV